MVHREMRATALALSAMLGVWGCSDDDTQPAAIADAAVAVDAATSPATVPSGASVSSSSQDAAASSPVIGGLDAGSATAPMTPGTPVVPVVPAVPAVYVAATRIFSTDGSQTTSYVQVLNSIDEGAKLETAKATEFGGSVKLFSLKSPRWVAVGEGESPMLSRYTASADRKLQKQETISLQNYGLKSFFSGTLYHVSATKAYLPDPDSAQLFTIDPTNMKVLGAISLPDTVREGYTPVYGYGSVQRTGKVLFTVAWFDWTNDKILPETGLVLVDTTTDKPLRTDVDTRCAGITEPITLPSGDTYFVSSALAAAAYQLGRSKVEPCALRIKAGAEVFDTTYDTKLGALTGGAVAGEPVPAGGEELFLRVFDSSLATIAADTASWGVTGQSAWRWRRWNPATGSLVNVDALQPSTADTYWFEVDGRVFNSQTTSDYATTTLIELNAAGGPKPALTAPGLISGLARIQ